MKGVRFLLNGRVIRVFMDGDWRDDALRAGLVESKDYDSIQVLRDGPFDTWETASSYY